MDDDDPATSDEHPVRGDETGAIRALDVAAGRRLVVRAADGDDLAALQALYGRMSVDDLNRRFFVGHVPPDRTTSFWLTVGERGGLALVAEVVEDDGSRLLVAEAGYALLADGDGELAITVDPQWRGWLGGWLLDVLTREAAMRGVGNLQADVLVKNRTMLALLRHRGHAAVSHPDWNTVRLVISTEGHTPGWPPDSDRPHLLVTSQGARWPGEAAALEAGFEVRTCPGPSGLGHQCPLAAGEPCPLLDGADALIFDLVPGTRQNADLADALDSQEIPVVMTRAPADDQERGPCLRISDIIDQVVEQLAERAADPEF